MLELVPASRPARALDARVARARAVELPATCRACRGWGGYAQLERHLLRNFRKYAHRERVRGRLGLELARPRPAPRAADAAARLDVLPARRAALRHRGPRTFDVDGVVWCVDFVRRTSFLPPALRAVLDERARTSSPPRCSSASRRTLARVRRAGRRRAVRRSSSSRRRSTSGSSTSSRFLADVRPDGALDAWLASTRSWARRSSSRAELKWEVRDKLDQANVTERVLFPGPRRPLAWLRRYYSPRHSAPDDLGGAT